MTRTHMLAFAAAAVVGAAAVWLAHRHNSKRSKAAKPQRRLLP